jgi:hypothetical protein
MGFSKSKALLDWLPRVSVLLNITILTKVDILFLQYMYVAILHKKNFECAVKQQIFISL